MILDTAGSSAVLVSGASRSAAPQEPVAKRRAGPGLGSRDSRILEPQPFCPPSAADESSTTAPLRPVSLKDRLGEPLPINFYASGQSPLEGLVPDPRTPVPAGLLERDCWLAEKCREPGYLEEFSALVAQRCALEEKGEEFCFPPLKTTLRNMCRFIDYIAAGSQFDDPLTAKEQQALARIRDQAGALEAAGAPYKRTVYLSLALMSLCEVITDRQVLGPLEAVRPEAFERYIDKVTGWSPCLALEADGAARASLSGAAVDPMKLVALNWGGNNPDSERMPFDSLTSRDSFVLYLLWGRTADYLRMQHLLLYPSFEDLDVADFCQFGHLGVHPVGLTTHYGCNADGTIRSPLTFAHHDLAHIQLLDYIGDPCLASKEEADYALVRRDRSLGWRQLLLDQLPAQLGFLNLAPALDVFLFQLMHEGNPQRAVTRYLEDGENPFVRCLGRMAQVRRHERNGYVKRYQAVTDREAALAVLWSLRLWRSWQTADYQPLAADRLEAFAQEFVARDLPRLQEHLDFVDQHWPALRQLFAECFGSGTTKDGRFEVRTDSRLRQLLDRTVLFASFDPRSGLSHLDYTDVAYFAALDSPELCQKITDRLETALPCPDVFRLAPFGSEPEPQVMDSRIMTAEVIGPGARAAMHPAREACPE